MMIFTIIFLSLCLVFLMGSLVALFVTKTNDEINRMELERNNKLESISNYYDEL